MNASAKMKAAPDTGRARATRAARILSVALLSALGAGATAEAQAESWTVSAAEAVALERSPLLRTAAARQKTAEAYRTFGTLPPVGNPVVGVRAMVGRPDDPAATYGLLIGLPFDVGGRRRAWRGEARFIAEVALAELEVARNDVRADVRAAYADVALAEAARKVAMESTETARELFDRVNARLAANAATALDVAQAEAQFAEAQADLANAEGRLVEAQDRFRQLLDLPPDRVVSVQPLPEVSVPSLGVEAAVARALSQRRELAVWTSTRERFRAADSRLRAEAVGPLTAAFEAEAQGNQRTNKSVGASVNFELPIVFRNQGERAVAKGEADAAAISRELTEHAITREVVTAYKRLDTALAELAALDRRAIPAAERTLAMVRTMLDSGAVDYFRLLTARANAFALRSRRVEAIRDAWMSRIALARATGSWEGLP